MWPSLRTKEFLCQLDILSLPRTSKVLVATMKFQSRPLAHSQTSGTGSLFSWAHCSHKLSFSLRQHRWTSTV